MLGRLEALCNLNGASGDEGRVRRYIRDIAKEYADEVWVDTMGNLYAHKKGEGRRVMVCAHMDEVGMIVWGAMDNGLLAYQAGGISVPCRYIHSPSSIASIRDFENAYRLADSFLKTKKFDEVL